MPTEGLQTAPLNKGAGTETETSAYFGDDGSGDDKWHHFHAVDDGANVSQGATTDAAITNPATDGTLVAFIRGILTQISAILAAFKAEDTAHTTADLGVMGLAVRRDTAAASSGATGDYEPLQTDSVGRLRTVARRDPTDTLSLVHMAALAASQVVKGSSGVLHSIVGYVASGEAGWIQVHDATSAPADTAVPELAYYVDAATAHQSVNIPLPGHVCATGITLVWSTTGPTKTVGAAKMMVAAYYE